MKNAWMRLTPRRVWIGWPVVAALIVSLGALTYAEVTIFEDDFEHYTSGDNPGVPIVGEPWQIEEVEADGIQATSVPFNSSELAMRFGRYRNVALAPFSTEHQDLIALTKSVTIDFDYTGYRDGPYSQYFDIASYDPASGAPAFVVRFSPKESETSSRLHDVLYLDPVGGLLDSGLDIVASPEIVQPITILVDLTAETYDLDVAGNSTTLPMFVCPNEIAGVEFANYRVASGSGAIDNLAVTVPDPAGEELEAASHVPEAATILLLLIGAFTLACARLLKRKPE